MYAEITLRTKDPNSVPAVKLCKVRGHVFSLTTPTVSDTISSYIIK